MSLDLEPAKLLSLHGLTKEVAQLCRRHLESHVEALTPLFRPRRILGDHIEGSSRETVPAADRNYADIQELYGRVAITPFDLRPELPKTLDSVATQLQFDEWEYTHATSTDRGWQPIRVTAPLTWVVSYASPYSFSALRSVVMGSGQRDSEAIGAYVLHACLIHELFAKIPSVGRVLAALRYRVEVRKSPPFGDLPLVTISAPFDTFRPPDELVALASGLAGGTSFAEVLNVDSVRNLPDTLRDQALRLIEKQKL
jgi:hypothetical protein